MGRTYYYHLACALFLYCFSADVYGQSLDMPTAGKPVGASKAIAAEKPAIKLIARPMQQSILLRWAPNNSTTWLQCNKYGYRLLRYTITRNGEIVPNPQPVELVVPALKPEVIDNWKEVIPRNKYAAVAAQAIYGATFLVKAGAPQQAGGPMQMVNKAREQDARYSMTIFSADQSFEAAQLCGMAWEDKNTKPSEKYLYRVIALVPSSIQKVDTGFVFTGIQEYNELPRIRNVEAAFSDRTAIVSWPRGLLDAYYTSYVLERSTDKKIFLPVEELPFVNTSATESEVPDKYIRADTFPENGKTYYYRLIGKNPFGQSGPPSDTVSGKGFRAFTSAPVINSARVENNTRVIIGWELPAELKPLISGLTLYRAANSKGPFQEIADEIKPTSYQFIDSFPKTANYYLLRAYDDGGASSSSFPVLALLIDSIPPSTPTRISGSSFKIEATVTGDSALGVIRLQWHPSPEEDVLGYRIYRANNPKHEFTQITHRPVRDTVYLDTIPLRVLSKFIYYSVVAIDHHFNPSAYSEAVAAKRPDIMPPAKPVFSNVSSQEGGVYLAWNVSFSEDIFKHSLYRRREGDTSFVLIKTIVAGDTNSTYIDTTAQVAVRYEYVLTATDDSGLESIPSMPVLGRRLPPSRLSPIQVFTALVNREAANVTLAWQYPSSSRMKFILYKCKAGEPLRMYKTFTSTQLEFMDTELTVGVEFTYALQVQDGYGVKSELKYVKFVF